MWARIDGDRVAEITDIDPEGRFHPSIQWVQFDGRKNVDIGDIYVGGEFSSPVVPLGELADSKRTEIDTARDTALLVGLSYTMPDGTQETVQTRAQDEPNLLGLAIEARDLKAEGVTDPVLTLRVESNRNYQLTPQQMIELTDATKNHKKLILAKSWQLKDEVDAALADEDREAIEAIKWE